jgi:hypothetical protein
VSSDTLAGDVAALVLSIGEPYTERAITSVRRQTPPVADLVIVRGVQPFHRALNEGAQRVNKPFFVQIDADMVLDDTCIADLRACMADGVGIVIGHLRDPLLRRVVGVKLFRTCCFDAARFEDSLSPDTDFGAALQASGWHSIYALKGISGPVDNRHTFGEHYPDYTPLYTFSKYLIEGARLRYRKVGSAARGLFRLLCASSHRAARFALIGAAHGIFVESARDLLRPYQPTADFLFLERLLRTGPSYGNDQRRWGDVEQDYWRTFRRGYRVGVDIRAQQASATLVAYIDELAPQRDVAAWVAVVSVCHAIFAPEYDEVAVKRSFDLLAGLLPG